MTTQTTKTEIYHYGDKAQYTGKTETLYGGIFYEIIWLKGTHKGETSLTRRAPETTNA